VREPVIGLEAAKKMSGFSLPSNALIFKNLGET
jgi:hypothetical protein